MMKIRLLRFDAMTLYLSTAERQSSHWVRQSKMITGGGPEIATSLRYEMELIDRLR